MLRIIQANDLALKLNVLAVCAVFLFLLKVIHFDQTFEG